MTERLPVRPDPWRGPNLGRHQTPGETPEPPARTPRDMVTDLSGTTARGGGEHGAPPRPHSGTSQRTIQRSIRVGLPRRSAAAERISSSHRTWRDTTAAGRRQIDDLAPDPPAATKRGDRGVLRTDQDLPRRPRPGHHRGRRRGPDATDHGRHPGRRRRRCAAALKAAFSDAFGGSVSLEVSSLDLT